MMAHIVLIGGGGHCKSCIDVLEAEGKYKIAGIVDVKEKLGQNLLGYPYIGVDSDIPELVKNYHHCLVTLGQIEGPDRRVALFNTLLGAGASLPFIVSPLAHVSRHARIGRGTIIMHRALVNAGAVVGANCIINTYALIEHDTIVEDHCHIATGALVNGGVHIGTKTFIGSGAMIKQYARVPESSFIKACSIFK